MSAVRATEVLSRLDPITPQRITPRDRYHDHGRKYKRRDGSTAATANAGKAISLLLLHPTSAQALISTPSQ
jgi:hypothetical protein